MVSCRALMVIYSTREPSVARRVRFASDASVRHPGTGRLMRAARLLFGYVDSPRLFCAVMEAMADKLHRWKAAALGGGMHFFVSLTTGSACWGTLTP